MAKKIAADPESRSMFAPITKVLDGPDGLFVEGVLVAEEPDRTGEIWDYASSVGSVIRWASDAASKTRGQSVGNLRAMHQPISAGKFVLIEPDDGQKLVTCRAKVVDEAEKTKVREGVYTGFSIKAPYARKWVDPNQPRFTRWTSGPIIEGSLADIPCIPSATFSYKTVGPNGDEQEETRRFSKYESALDLDDLANRVAAKLDRGTNEEELDMNLVEIAKKHNLDPAAFKAGLEEAAKTLGAAAQKCMKSAADCADADCDEHKAAKVAAAKAISDAAAKKIVDDAAIAAAKIDGGTAIKAADIRAIFVEEISKMDAKIDAAVAAKLAPVGGAIDSLTTVVGRLAGVAMPTAVNVRGSEQVVDKSQDGAADAAKVNGAAAPEDAEKIAKDKGAAAGVMAIHRNGPSLIMTNQGLRRSG